MGLHKTYRRCFRCSCFTLRPTLYAFILTVASQFPVSYPLSFPLPLFAASSQAASPGDGGNHVPDEEQSEFYQYVDKDGVIHFVDSVDKIPRRYQNRFIVRKNSAVTQQTTNVVIVNNKIQVPVSIKSGENMVHATLILDTGASITCITETLARLLKIDPESTRLVSMGLADGRMIDIHVTKVDSVAVGDRMKSPFVIGIIPDLGKRGLYDGYLGLDFINTFNFQIDFQNNLIRWQ